MNIQIILAASVEPCHTSNQRYLFESLISREPGT